MGLSIQREALMLEHVRRLREWPVRSLGRSMPALNRHVAIRGPMFGRSVSSRRRSRRTFSGFISIL